MTTPRRTTLCESVVRLSRHAVEQTVCPSVCDNCALYFCSFHRGVLLSSAVSNARIRYIDVTCECNLRSPLMSKMTSEFLLPIRSIRFVKAFQRRGREYLSAFAVFLAFLCDSFSLGT